MSELFPTFPRLFRCILRVPRAIARGIVRAVMFPIRTVRRSWKPILLAVLVLNMLLTISNYFERRYIEQYRAFHPQWSHDRYNSDENPYRHYETAMRLITREDLDLLSDAFSSHEPEVTQEEIDQALDRAQPAIEAIRRGAACSGEDFEFAYKRASWSEIYPEFAHLRRVARMASLDASRKLEREQIPDALQGMLNVVEMGNDIRRSGGLNGHWVGGSISAIGMKPLHEALISGKGNVGEYRIVARGLEKIHGERLPFSSVLEGGYRFGLGEMDEVLTLYPHIMRECMNAPLLSAYVYVPWMKARTLRNYHGVFQGWIEASEKPYPESIAFDYETLIPRTDLVNLVIHPPYHLVHAADVRDEALTLGLMLVAAMEAHKLEHGAYPESLDALAGDYLASIPTDPFTDGKPFVYSKTEDSYMLYSVGPNMTDDGGMVKPASELRWGIAGDLVFTAGKDLWTTQW